MFHLQHVSRLESYFSRKGKSETHCNHEHAAYIERFRRNLYDPPPPPHEHSSFSRFMSSLVPTALMMHSDIEISFKDYRFDHASKPPEQRMEK